MNDITLMWIYSSVEISSGIIWKYDDIRVDEDYKYVDKRNGEEDDKYD